MQREKCNLDIIAALHKGTANHGLLKQYSGWGGLRKTIYTPAYYMELKKYLSDDEILAIKRTLSNAYFTPEPIIKFMYQYLQGLGFKGGCILEPGAGHGAFIEHMPPEIRQKSKIYAVEIEPISTKILAALYPDVKVKNCGFETLESKSTFDLVIGNPPYGAETLKDPYHADLNHLVVHHYFVAKAMRLLKEGGLLAMVLPSYFLDNRTAHARGIIAQEAGNLVAAIRLPDDLFTDAKVTVDIVFLQKGGQQAFDWVNVSKKEVQGKEFYINNYYLTNPKQILGDLSFVWLHKHARYQLTCKSVGNNTYEKLQNIVVQQDKGRVEMPAYSSIDALLAVIEYKIGLLEAKRAELFKLKNTFTSITQEAEAIAA